VEEATGVCKDRSKWKKVLPTLMGNRRDFMYEYMNYMYIHNNQ
jgi:hypothetical protein